MRRKIHRSTKRTKRIKRTNRTSRKLRGGLFNLFRKSKTVKKNTVVPTDKPLADDVIREYNLYVEPVTKVNRKIKNINGININEIDVAADMLDNPLSTLPLRMR